MIQRLDVRGIEAGAPLAVHRREDHGGGVAADVVVVAERVLEQLGHGLGGLDALNGEEVVDGGDVEEGLHDLALFAPFGTVL